MALGFKQRNGSCAMCARFTCDGECRGPRPLREIEREELYEGVVCEACEKAPAVVTDVNGMDLCADCAEGCKLPELHA